MNYHKSYVLQDLSNSFHRWFNLSNFSLWSASKINGGLSHCHSLHLKTKEELLLNLAPFSSKIRGSSLRPSSHNCFWLWEFFSPIRSISWVVSISFLRSPSCHNSSFSTFNSCSPNLTSALLKWSLISSWSLCSLVSNSLKYLHSFSNSYRWFTPLLLSFSILTVVRSRFHFLR